MPDRNSAATELSRPPRRRSATITIAGISYAIRVISIVENIVLIPLYLRFLGAQLYGYWLATGGMLAWLGMFDFGVAAIIKQRCAQAYGEKDYQKACGYFSHGMLAYVALSVIVLLVSVCLSYAVGPIFRIPAESRGVVQIAFVLASIGLVMSVVRSGMVSFSQALQRPNVTMYTALAAQIVHFGTCFWLIMAGFGLHSIPIGLIVRNLAGNSLIAVQAIRLFREIGGRLRFDKSIARDYLHIGPMLVLSRFGTRAAQRIEPTLIALFMKPEIATAYVITKKLAEVLQGLLSTARGAILPGFAHLCAQQDHAKTRRIYATLIDFVFWGTIALLAVYICTNEMFVRLWVGSGQFVGTGMTVLLAISILTVHLSGTESEVYTAKGAIGTSSVAVAVESLVRVGLMAAALPLWGLYGLPIAAITSSTAALVYFKLRLRLALGVAGHDVTKGIAKYSLGAVVLAAATLVSLRLAARSPILLSTCAVLCFSTALFAAALTSSDLREEIARTRNLVRLNNRKPK